MQNPRLAGRYAKSLIDIATETNQLEAVWADANTLQAIIAASTEFASLLKSPVIKADKKQKVMDSLFTGRVGNLMQMFVGLLIKKGREKFLPEILVAFQQAYDERNGIHHISVRTAVPLSEAMEKAIVSKIEKETGLTKVNLHTAVQEDLIGGFVIEFDNNLIDASVRKYLRDVKGQFKSNTYIRNIR